MDDGWVSTTAGPGRAEGGAKDPRADAAARERVPWDAADAVPAMIALPGRDRSQHFGATVDRSVRVNERAMGYAALTDRTAFPPGATIFQAHHAPDRAPGAPDDFLSFAMTKQAPGWSPETEDWEYLVVDSALRVVERGKLAACARCHAAAPHRPLFGPPAREGAVSPGTP